jgi:hypothetical protein
LRQCLPQEQNGIRDSAHVAPVNIIGGKAEMVGRQGSEPLQ